MAPKESSMDPSIKEEKKPASQVGIAPQHEYPTLSHYMGRVAGEEAMRYSRDFEANSKLARHLSRKKRTITEIRWSDLKIGHLLGEGNFSHVYEVRLKYRDDLPDTDTVATVVETIVDDVWNSKSIDWKSPPFKEDLDIWDLVSVAGDHDSVAAGDLDSDSASDDDDESIEPKPKRKFKERVYALKHLHPQVTTKQNNFTASAVDLVLEAKLLSCLEHPNIVKLFGVTEGSINKVFSGNGYFLLLDRLHETLEDKILEWTAMEAIAAVDVSTSSSQKRSSSKGRRKADVTVAEEGLSQKERGNMLSERIASVAIDIAHGMEYLHSNRIVFRDLKPSNIGFTKSNRVKIFDFGLAREIVDSTKRLTGNTGSLRYMAPEVNRHDHYGLPADVYSFGILLWEIAVLQKPFKGMNIEEHAALVIKKGYRPTISLVPGSEDYKKLVQACWSTVPEQRPNFTDIRRSLANEVEAHRRLEELELEEMGQEKIAPKTGKLRMILNRQSVYAKSGVEGSFANVPFS